MNGSGRPVGVRAASEVAFYIDDTHSMSERVQSLADAVYKEFERLIKAYDENVVKDLMPLVVAILEGLESSCREKQQLDVDAELLRDDNDQLLAQYEKERQLRRIADQKYLALEDSMEEERKQLQGRLESFESIVRMFEIKLKNSQDQVARMDEKEQETKKEFSKLHERYTDLLKAHMDFKERVKTLVSGNPSSQDVVDQSSMTSDLTLPRNFKFPNLASKHDRSEFSDVESSSELSSPVKSTSRPLVQREDDYDDDDDDGESERANKSICFEINNAINSEEDQSTGPKRLISIDEHLRKSLIGEMDKLHLTFCEEDGNYESQIRPGVFEDMESDERSELALGDPSKAGEEQDLRQEDDDDDGGDDNDYSDADHYNFYGVSKEIENLIMENNELLETKHALNIVKDDLIAKVDELTGEKEILKDELNTAVQSKERTKARVAELEEELRKMREELDRERNKDSGSNHGDGEEDGLPPGQRKRFTRLEMARVLMERNQYKERLMELQEAVRWAEMVRAARDHPEFGGEKKKSSVWNFFNNLFGSSRSNSSFVDHSTSGDHSSFMTPNSDQRSVGLNSILDRRRRRTEERNMETPTGPSKLHPPPAQEESRLVACGWSLPPKFQLNRTLNFDAGSTGSITSSVPLPVFCKPLLEEDPNIKILCAAAITWKGGRTSDGGDMVGTSVFYPDHGDPLGATRAAGRDDDEIEKLNEEILSREKEIKDVNDFPMGCGGNDPDPYHVWVCVDDRTGSHVIVVDAGNEGEVLEKFHVCLPNLHCITGVPGATEDSYTIKENSTSSSSSSSSSSPQTSLPGHVTYVQLNDSYDHTFRVKGDPQESKPFVDPVEEEVERSLNLQPTVWMGNIAGSLYIYSADPSSRKRLHVIKLGDSIMNICHLRGKVFVALANGTVACFSRASEGQWNVRSHHIIELAQPTFAVRSAAVVAKKFLWCSVANDIFVIDPATLAIGDRFNAHPRKESHVRHMAWMGEGVWVGFRNDSSLRLYHAYTHQYLQDVDIEPCVSKFLGSSKLGFSLVQISCLMTSQDRLWIGTGNGVVINIPISESYEPGVLTSVGVGMMEIMNNASVSTPTPIGGHKAPGGVVRVYGDKKNEEIYPGSFIPYCSLGQVQLSFHGLKEVVKFIIAMPGNEKKIPTTKIGQKHAEIYRKYSLPLPSSTSLTLSQSQSSTAIGGLTPEPSARAKCLWIMCGGEGCSDFRLGEDMSSAVDRNDIEHSDSTGDVGMEDVGVINMLPKSDKSHVIMWQILVP